MSVISSSRQRYNPKFTEICVGNISGQTEPNKILNYFQEYGSIIHYNFTSPTGGYLFITYEHPSMVDQCIANRPHNFDGRLLYVKRALPVDDEHPRERFETTRDLMILIDFDYPNRSIDNFLIELRDYFSKYGRIYACKYCQEKFFSYILVEFADKDHVDRIILDKPHYYNDHELHVMKLIPSNIELMNKKYSLTKQPIEDAVDQDDFQYPLDEKKKEGISEIDLENEVYRLQNMLKQMSEDFSTQRKQLENSCSDELKQFIENIEKNHHVQRDLEKELTDLTAKYDSLKHENDLLNEQYLNVELENFEITSYYEQLLDEEKTKTLQLEDDYTKKLQLLHNNSVPSNSLMKSQIK